MSTQTETEAGLKEYVAWARKRYPDAPDGFFIKPAAIADEVWHVVHQDRSAWSFNVELRPYGETW